MERGRIEGVNHDDADNYVSPAPVKQDPVFHRWQNFNFASGCSAGEARQILLQ
jgi:hypothetical protein